MSTIALVLLLLVAASPATLVALHGSRRDPVVPLAAGTVVVLGLAATAAAESEGVAGWRTAAALVLGVAAATTAGSPVVRAVFRVIRRELLPVRVPAAAAAPAADSGEAQAEVPEPGTVLRGGAWIGYLERAAVASTLLAGWPEGIALVLAVKGVGRYAELRQPDAPEAFIIGTLTSLLWAAAAVGTVTLLR